MKKYDNYKPSGFEWLGEIPAHWEVKRVKDVAFYQSGEYINALDFEEENLYPVYGGNGLRGYADKYNTNGNYVLIGRQGALCGNINYANGKFWATEHCVVVYNKKNIVVKWLGELLTVMNLNQYSQSTAQPGLSVDKIKRLELPVPPLPEQTAIATYLDHKTQAIDKKIVLLTQKAAYYKELRKALINRAVTEGIAENVEMKDSGVEWIGRLPKYWEVKRLKDISQVKRGASPRPIEDPIYFDDNGEFSWVRISDLTASERYLELTTEKLSALGASHSVKRYPNDFFLSIAGTVGKPIITKIKCCIHDGFVWFPNLKINAEYLYYIFSTGLPYQGLGKLGTQLNLNTETVGLISIPVPPKDEIELIVNYLDEKTSLIDAIVANIEKQVVTLKELRKTLINEVVTGKVKITND